MINDVTRYIKRNVERTLWARSAGRCQFDGCNRTLYKSPITQEKVNISEKAHIYSFSVSGPRGWGPFVNNKNKINDLGNLMLVCHDCHKTLDKDKEGRRYSADLLIKWKNQHEDRVEFVTGICPDKKSHVILYGAKIGDENSPLNPVSAMEAIFPEWYPADEKPIVLSMSCSHDDRSKDYWRTESSHLYSIFNRDIKPRIEESAPCGFSLFSLAPQPLLILLGTLFTDKIPVEVYQLHREPPTWMWQDHPTGFNFIVNQPSSTDYNPVLIISLSDEINHDRIFNVLDEKVSIWELTVKDCHNDFLKSKAQLSMFRESVRRLMVLIKKSHGCKYPLRIFPAMPVACAVEFGRVRMPKADMPLIIYDQNNKAGEFIESIQIPGVIND